MTLNFEDLKIIDERTKDLVKGYIRKSVNEDSIIPSLVASICILFYHLREFFSICGDNMVISDCFTKLTTKVDELVGPASCYGIVPINPKMTCIYSWEFKRICTNSRRALIGIASDKSILNETFQGESCYFYGVTSDGCRIAHDYEEDWSSRQLFTLWKPGNILTMIINTKKRNFAISFNGEPDKIVYEDIKFEEGIDYFMAVSNYGDPDDINCIQLVSFTQKFLN